jgi:hypothetical protein
MAGHTVRWEIGGLMVGIVRAIIVCLVTGHTVGVSITIIPRGMALRTIQIVMSQGQWEKVMVDIRWCPSRVCRVATYTIRREANFVVVRIVGTVIIRLVAAYTVGICIRIVAGRMALCTVQICVPLRQWEKIVISWIIRIPFSP